MAIINAESKIIKKKKLDKELSLTIFSYNERIYVDFKSKDGKLNLQKTYQDNYYGRKEAETFEGTIESIDDLKAYFERKLNVTK